MKPFIDRNKSQTFFYVGFMSLDIHESEDTRRRRTILTHTLTSQILRH